MIPLILSLIVTLPSMSLPMVTTPYIIIRTFKPFECHYPSISTRSLSILSFLLIMSGYLLLDAQPVQRLEGP